MRLLALLLIPVAIHADSENKYCAPGSTFEKRCLSLPYPTAYVNGYCIVAIEDSSASSGQVAGRCTGLGKLSGISGTPFRLSNDAQKKEIESFYALKQTGFYYGASGEKIVPTKGNTQTVVGYLCSFFDSYGCASGWFRFRDHCYEPISQAQSQSRAATVCRDRDANLPIINDDEQNKFVAMLARRELFSDSLGQNPIWGSLAFTDGEWQHRDASGPSTKKVKYMRWWSLDEGTYTTVKPPSTYDGQTLFTGKNDDKLVGYFGYWGTEQSSEKLQFICQRPLQLLQ